MPIKWLATRLLQQYGRNTYLEVDDLVQEVRLVRWQGNKRRAKFIMQDVLRKTYPFAKKEIPHCEYCEAFHGSVEGQKLNQRIDLIDFINRRPARERKILRLILHGYTSREISKILGLHESRISQMIKEIVGDNGKNNRWFS